MSLPDLSPEMLQHLSELHNRGIDFTEAELWVYKKCSEQPYTTGQLASLRDVTYQAMHPVVKNLSRLGILHKALSVGKETYWQTYINLEYTSDLRLKFTYRNEQLTFENLIWYLHRQADYEVTLRFIKYGLSHLYMNAQRRHKGDKNTQKPPSSEIRSMLMALRRELEQIVQLVEQVISIEELYQLDPLLYERLGEYDDKTEHFIAENARFFGEHWGEHISAAGFKKNVIGNFKTQAQSEQTKDEWKDLRA